MFRICRSVSSELCDQHMKGEFNQHFVSGSVSVFDTIRHGKRNCQSRFSAINGLPHCDMVGGSWKNFITSEPGAWAAIYSI